MFSANIIDFEAKIPKVCFIALMESTSIKSYTEMRVGLFFLPTTCSSFAVILIRSVWTCIYANVWTWSNLSRSTYPSRPLFSTQVYTVISGTLFTGWYYLAFRTVQGNLADCNFKYDCDVSYLHGIVYLSVSMPKWQLKALSSRFVQSLGSHQQCTFIALELGRWLGTNHC